MAGSSFILLPINSSPRLGPVEAPLPLFLDRLLDVPDPADGTARLTWHRTLGKPWENYGRIMGESCLILVRCDHLIELG